MRDRFGAKSPRSWLLRFHTQTAGCSLTAPAAGEQHRPHCLAALAAGPGWHQSLHTTTAWTRRWRWPSEYAAKIALRTQQLIAYESGVTNTVDPLAGSYFVEAVTNRMEQETYDYFHKIEALGGVIPALEKGFMQREIAESRIATRSRSTPSSGTVVGVNNYVEEGPVRHPAAGNGPQGYERQGSTAGAGPPASGQRAGGARRWRRCTRRAQGTENTMPPYFNCVRGLCARWARSWVCFRQVFGEYREPTII